MKAIPTMSVTKLPSMVILESQYILVHRVFRTARRVFFFLELDIIVFIPVNCGLGGADSGRFWFTFNIK